MNIKELHDALDAYHTEHNRPKFADGFIYACFLDYLDEYASGVEEYVLKQGVTIEDVWSKYTEPSSPLINMEYGYESTDSWARDWFTESFCTETEGEDNE